MGAAHSPPSASGSGPRWARPRSSTSARPPSPACPPSRSSTWWPASRTRRRAFRPCSSTGYERAEWGDFGERLFLRRRSADGSVTHHLSLTTVGSSYWDDHLAFRDALRASPELCERYATLKRDQAAAHEDIDAYTRAKTALVRDALLSVGHRPRSGWAAGDA